MKRLPPRMTQGLIAPLAKEGDKEYLSKWSPITLLNSSYKIFTKVLQVKLQNLLSTIIHEDQFAFLLRQYIIKNMLALHETIYLVEELDQDLILVKLDFNKAYIVVSWPFLFHTMAKMGILGEFIEMVKMLFQDAQAIVSLNSKLIEPFLILWEVCQRCPHAPYLFVLVDEALHAASRATIQAGDLIGILLLNSSIYQTLL